MKHGPNYGIRILFLYTKNLLSTHQSSQNINCDFQLKTTNISSISIAKDQNVDYRDLEFKRLIQFRHNATGEARGALAPPPHFFA